MRRSSLAFSPGGGYPNSGFKKAARLAQEFSFLGPALAQTDRVQAGVSPLRKDVLPPAFQSQGVLARRQRKASLVVVFNLEFLGIEIVLLDRLSGHVIRRLADIFSVEINPEDAVVLGISEAQNQTAVLFFLHLKFHFDHGILAHGLEQQLALAGPVVTLLDFDEARMAPPFRCSESSFPDFDDHTRVYRMCGFTLSLEKRSGQTQVAVRLRTEVLDCK